MQVKTWMASCCRSHPPHWLCRGWQRRSLAGSQELAQSQAVEHFIRALCKRIAGSLQSLTGNIKPASGAAAGSSVQQSLLLGNQRTCTLYRGLPDSQEMMQREVVQQWHLFGSWAFSQRLWECCRLLADSQQLAQIEAAERKATRPGYGPAGEHSSGSPSLTSPVSPGQLATPMRIGQDLHGFLTGSAPHIPPGEPLS